MSEQSEGDRAPREAGARHRRSPHLALAWLAWIVVTGLTLAVVAAGLATTAAGQGDQSGVVGVGYSRGDAGEFILHPWPGYPAAAAGIAPGDILLAVDGDPVPMDAFRVHPEGPVGTSVTLTVRAADGAVRQHALIRSDGPVARAVARLGLPPGFLPIYNLLLEVALILPFLTIGLLLAARRRDDGFMLFISLALVLQAAGQSVVGLTLRRAHPDWGWAVDLLQTLGPLCTLPVFYLFPDGRFAPRWTAGLTAGWVVWVVVLRGFPDLPSDLGVPAWLLDLLYAGWYVTGLSAQAYRYRRVSGPIERQQTKWVLLGGTVATIGYYAWVFADRAVSDDPAAWTSQVLLWLLVRPLSVLALLCAPLAIVAAVRRYRLWDIDALISRALLYGTLTSLLVGTYWVTVAASQYLVAGLTGRQGSSLAVVMSTLGCTALFRPLRLRLQSFIDRRFYRRKYDAARALAGFGAQLRDDVDLDQLNDVLLAVVRETVQPAHVSLWLRLQETPTPAGERRAKG